MKIEENVDVETTKAEEVAQANEENEKALTVLGKFKDVDALARAYESLQAEFTRRSQRLKSLEKEVDNLKGLAMQSGVEKLRKTAQARREEAKAFDAFIAEVDGGVSVEKPNRLEGDEVVCNVAQVENAEEETENSEAEAMSVKGEKEEKSAVAVDGGAGAKLPVLEEVDFSKETLFQRAVNDEDVRLRIVGEYLSSLGKVGAPLMKGGGGALTSPPVRARTVGEAGDMALLYFKKPRA